MVYSIVYDALKTKTTLFEKPATIINLNELAAAICMGYQQAGLTPPPLEVGVTVEAFRNQFLENIKGNSGVNQQLITAISEYPHEKATFDQMAKETYEYKPE